MDECYDLGAPSPFGQIVSDVVPLLVNWFIADKMLDAQEYYEDKMKEVADAALDAAEELFAAHMAERGKDAAVFGFMNSQPFYDRCNTSPRAFTDAKRQATAELREGLRGVSRCDQGLRHELIMESAGAFIVNSSSVGATAWHVEDSIEDEYITNHYDAIASAALGSSSTAALGFGGAAATWSFLADGANANAKGAVAGVGYFGRRMVGNFFDGRYSSQSTGDTGFGNLAVNTNNGFSANAAIVS